MTGFTTDNITDNSGQLNYWTTLGIVVGDGIPEADPRSDKKKDNEAEECIIN